jgi:hypothetical protein
MKVIGLERDKILLDGIYRISMSVSGDVSSVRAPSSYLGTEIGYLTVLVGSLQLL